ncbi:cytochrome c-type biogenesis protein CcmE [bacterium BMS3Abin05]|nr:cytochrome c-type biogenesis protein CcmE [bacterium BMS3Abin05]GBE27743.1 cytochrome c-type biogenesis protein CcmE [bacterium BMS3Bbin03]HDZ13090.1 cytochrome c maturation protein CcmE [Bacteroidota bacterium]
MKKRTKYSIGVVIILFAFAILLYKGLSKSMMAYMNVSDIGKIESFNKDSIMQVTGIVVPGTIQNDSTKQQISFMLRDLKKPKQVIQVNYAGLIPDSFKPGLQVVVIGIIKNKIIQAQRILTKCPSKYNKNDERELKND